MISIPQAFVQSTLTREGEAGRQWLDQLPRLVDALCVQWDLVMEGPVRHGYLGLVMPVRCGAEPCVLKISWREESNVDEATALAAWNGQGAVRLLAVDPEQGALLLERLDATRSLRDLPVAVAEVIAGQLLRRLAIPAPSGLRTVATMAADLVSGLPERWEQYGRPVPRTVLEHACDLARHLGPTGGNLLVNYDLIYEDVLAGQREPWLVVDPKVAVGDPAFGLAQLLWTRLEEIEAAGGLDRHFRRLVEAAEVDLDHARAWTLVRCVDYWLWGLSVGLTEDPVRCAKITNWLSRMPM